MAYQDRPRGISKRVRVAGGKVTATVRADNYNAGVQGAEEMARRLQEIAGKGQIFIGESTYERVSECVVAQRSLEQAIRGRDDPIVSYTHSVTYGNRLKGAGIKTDVQIIDGVGHTIPPALREQLIKESFDFVDAVLGK